MDDALRPLTEPGAQFVALAESHAETAWEAAAERDSSGRFPVEAFEEMKQSGLTSAPIPTEFGGLGLTSVHDLVVGVERIGRGDGSIAIALNMHLAFAMISTRQWRGLVERGEDARADGLAGMLETIGAGAIGMANITEGGTDLLHPLTEATKVDGGWSVSGRKIFGTLSEIADLFYVSMRVRDDNGDRVIGGVIGRGTEGQKIGDDWDAMGMRASGSHMVTYDECFVPDAQVPHGYAAWGSLPLGSLIAGTVGQVGLFGAFLGIAERASALAKEHALRAKKAPSGRPIAERSGIQRLVAESEVGLSTSRAMVHRLGEQLDIAWARPVADVSTADFLPLAEQTQCVKLVVNRAAIDTVDNALAISGGAGYMSGHPLARLYRDVRAGPFMQPYSPVEAYEFIGKLALGLDPTTET